MSSRHPIFLFFSSLGVMLIVPTSLQLPVAYDDDITRQQIVTKTTNLIHIHIGTCRNLQLIIR